MEDALAKFDPKDPCPKCGGKSIEIRYHASSGGCTFDRQLSENPHHSETVFAEHIHSYCGYCKYEWARRPHDVPGPVEDITLTAKLEPASE